MCCSLAAVVALWPLGQTALGTDTTSTTDSERLGPFVKSHLHFKLIYCANGLSRRRKTDHFVAAASIMVACQYCGSVAIERAILGRDQFIN